MPKTNGIVSRLKVAEVFQSIQGEGRYAGTPVLFIRLSGCTRKCDFCDTGYHKSGTLRTVRDLAANVVAYEGSKVVFTGGEPLLQRDGIIALYYLRQGKYFHLETNGDLLRPSDFFYYDYVCISPKSVDAAKRAVRVTMRTIEAVDWDIKVVTDLNKVGVDLIPYATMLMPLTTKNEKRDRKIRQRVWEYCSDPKNNVQYSPRLHVETFGWRTKR